MAVRRIPSNHPVKSPPERPPKRWVRNNKGITKSLHTIVDTAMVSTMTMLVAADTPPTNAIKASQPYPCDKGNDSTKVSG